MRTARSMEADEVVASPCGWIPAMAFLLASGCTADVEPGHFRCDPDGLCPPGWSCLTYGPDQICVLGAQSVCGNGILEPGEQCDGTDFGGHTCEAYFPGFLPLTPACTSFCGVFCPGCGNAIPEAGEACDDGGANSDVRPDACRTDCRLPQCADGVVDGGETCDDGDTWDGDGCSSACQTEPGWTCLGVQTSTCVPGVWTALPAGSFVMGSPGSEAGRGPDESPHPVTLGQRFELQTTEVTRGQYSRFVGDPPAGGSCAAGDCPVGSVTWHEAAAYCNELSSVAGLPPCYACSTGWSNPDTTCVPRGENPYTCLGYRLPTEAEWEYAARAGTAAATYAGELDPGHLGCEQPNPVVDPIAWYCGNASDQVHAVGGLDPNPWGLHDLLGNVSEWVHDWYAAYPGQADDPRGPGSGTARVHRGGSASSAAQAVRTARRAASPPYTRGREIGFRCARTLP